MPDCREIGPLVTPYVDGEAPAAQRAAVDQHLTGCPPCRRRVEAESAARQVLRAKAPALGSRASEDLKSRCARNRALIGRAATWRARAVPLSFAAVGMLTLGIVVFVLTARSVTVLAAQLTLDHVKCFALGGVAPTESVTVASKLETQYGWRMTVPPSSSSEHLQLVGGRRCLYGEGPVAHIMYRHDGHPLSMFMLPATSRGSDRLQVMGHETVMWSSGGRSYLIVAREPRVKLERIAAYLKNNVQ